MVFEFEHLDCIDPRPDVTLDDTITLQRSNSTQLDVPDSAPPAVKMQCLYDKNCTGLFKAIENEDWHGVMEFLDTGKWPGISLIPDWSPQEQVMTVVTCANKYGKVRWSRLPLHEAILNEAPLGIIRRLVDLYPSSVSMTDQVGNVPLHLALLSNTPNNVVIYLLAKYPKAANTKNRDGLKPIDVAVRASNPKDKARGKILKLFAHFTTTKKTPATNRSSGLECDYDENCSKLYTKIQSRDWSRVMHFLNKGEWQADNLISDMVNTIFYNQETGTPEEEVKALVVRHYSKDGKDAYWARLPLHLAILCDAPLPIVSRLVDIYPASVYTPDWQSMLPIHLAMYYGASDDVVAYLLMRYPDSINKKGLDGLTPLECALEGENAPRGQMIQMFLKEVKSKHVSSFKPKTMSSSGSVAGSVKSIKSSQSVKLVSKGSIKVSKTGSGVSVISAGSLCRSKSRD